MYDSIDHSRLASGRLPLAPRTLLLLMSLAAALAGQSAPQTIPASPAAPTALRDMSLEQLSQIEVTSPSKEPTPAFRSPVAIYVITGEDIRRSGAKTIPDALRLAPGVEVAQIDSSKFSVGIRGFGTRNSRDVLVLIDGRTVYTPLFAGTYWEVQDTLLEDIDRIEVIRGPGGTIWGPNAVDGVINIITKSSKDTQGAYVETGGGNVQQGFVSARYGGAVGSDLTWRAYAKSYTRGPEQHFDGDDFDAWRGAQGGFRMDSTPNARDTYTLQGDIYTQEAGERVGVSTYVPPTIGTADGYAYASGEDILFRWTRKLSDRSDFQIQTYWDRTARHEPNLGEIRDTWDVDFSGRVGLPFRQELLYGLEGRVSPDHFQTVISGLVFYPFHRADYLVSGFLQDDISLIDRKLTLSLGTKLLRTNYAGYSPEPSARIIWTPDDKHSVWAAYTHAVRTPSDAEEDFYLSSYQGMASGYEVFARFDPNPSFAPEQMNGYELGYRQLLGKNFYLDVALFYNRYHDLFSQDLAGPIALATGLPFPVPVEPPTYLLIPAQFRNDLYGFTTGGEIAPEWRPTEQVRLRASYSYLNMNLSKSPTVALGETPAMVEGSSPRHEATFESSFDISKKLQLDLIYRYVSALPVVSAPAYSTGDVRFAWRFASHLELSLVGRNLMQPWHVEYSADPGGAVGIVRSGYASIEWR